MSKSLGTRFRELILRPEGVLAFGVESVISAKVAALAGQECIYAGGYAAAGMKGWPDMGVLTMTEMLEHARLISRAVSVPVIADIDDGYGSVLNVKRTVSEFLGTTPVAGLHLEDQKYPKRCGHIAGKAVLGRNEFLGKLRLALKIRDEIDPTRFIIARTDAFGAAGSKKDPVLGGDMEEVVARGVAYLDAGADSVWCEFPRPDRKSATAFAEGVRRVHPQAVLSFNVSASFAWHLEEDVVTQEELNELGYKFLFTTYPSLLENTRAVYELAKAFRERGIGAIIELKQKLAGHPMESFMKTVDVEQYQEMERQYSPDAEDRLKTSEGFKG
ncbi:MAG: isocitrate lyase/PEP mutase family protein [Candidatus Sungiibacteriota bacterium]|uniref:Isocitrate lyase/PEP mutase family protein n=1 Tax=Candidatus Sungiibacteriota bacterium TaxID=2750080 RepID=A0A7T5USJ6_9BACT|nr:MAG: isocitrate lyase/PEP mutase family protein [Candidatus Sungbacteria bacterium]